MMTTTQRLFGFDFIDDVDHLDTVMRVLGPQPDDGLLPLVVTPNVDDLVRLSVPSTPTWRRLNKKPDTPSPTVSPRSSGRAGCSGAHCVVAFLGAASFRWCGTGSSRVVDAFLVVAPSDATGRLATLRVPRRRACRPHLL